MRDETAVIMQEELLKSYFFKHGILLCNENAYLPSLSSVGGDWNSIVALIEEGQIFYSKLYKGRVTYLSRDFYAQIKPYKQRVNKVSQTSRLIFDFLKETDRANTAEIKNVFKLSSKTFSESMDELCRELLITAIERDRTMNVNWSSFYWGTYGTWERLHPISEITVSSEALKMLLSGLLSDRQIDNIMK